MNDILKQQQFYIVPIIPVKSVIHTTNKIYKKMSNSFINSCFQLPTVVYRLQSFVAFVLPSVTS